jgi:hypothetical protein
MMICFQQPFSRDRFPGIEVRSVDEFERAHSVVRQFSPYSKTFELCCAELHQCFSSSTRELYKHNVEYFEEQARSYLGSVVSIETRVYVVAIAQIIATKERGLGSHSAALQNQQVLSPICFSLSFRRLSKCTFSNCCTEEDVESDVAERLDFFDDFSREYRLRADSNGTPKEKAEKDVQYFKELLRETLDAQKAQAIGIIHRFEEMRSLFPSVEKEDFLSLSVEDRQRFLWVRPQLEALFRSSDRRLLSAECWKGLVYMLSVMPANGSFMQASLDWLKGQTVFSDLPSLIRAVGYASHIPLGSVQQLDRSLRQGEIPVRPWVVGSLTVDGYLKIFERIIDFRRAVDPLLQTPIRRLHFLLPRGLPHSLFATRSPVYIEWLVLTIRKVFLNMPIQTQQALQSLDAESVQAVLSSRKDLLWTAREEETIAELLIIYAHLLYRGFGGRGASRMILRAVQKVREEVLLNSDPFLLEHPLSDPCLAILNLTEPQLHALRETVASRKGLRASIVV